MDEYEVNCISKPQGTSGHEHITHIGHSGHGWRMNRAAVIAQVEAQAAVFYTVDKASGKRMYIGVARGTEKGPHLRSYAQGKWNDNLLTLPECGSRCRLVE